MIKLVSHSTEETESIGKKLSSVLNGSEVIAMFGDLGAGKTAFVRGLCEGLSCADVVSSPTFAIVNRYEGKFPVYHFDMYRITTLDDLYSTGYYDYLGTGLVVIEWSENIVSELDDDALRIHIEYAEEPDSRVIQIDGIDIDADTFC